MQTATNPQTGERVQWNGSQWVPAGTSAPQAGMGPVTVGSVRPPKPRDPLEVRKDELSIEKSELDIAEARRKAAQGPAVKADDVKIQQKRASLNSLEQQINRVEELYRGGLKEEAFGILSSIGEFLPTEGNRQFDAASAGLAEQGLSAFRVPGVGAQSDTELRQFVQANRPSASDYDATIEEKLRQLRVRVDATRGEMGLPPAQWLGAEQPSENATVTPEQTIYSGNLGGEQAAPSDNGFQTVEDPEMSGVRGEYLRRLEAGEGPGAIVAFLRKAGVSDPKILRSAVEQANFRRKNPNVPIDHYNTDALVLMDVPLSTTESMMNDAAQSAGGAYAMRAGNAITMNNLDSIVGATGGNAERTRIALEDAGRSSPLASLAGDLSGGVMAALGAEAGLARAGMSAGFGRALAADTAYGVGAGAGANDDNRMQGAVQGGLAGLIGSTAGQGATKAVGSIVGGPSDASVRALADQGIPMTVGQSVGRSGRLGQMVKGVEDRLSGVPVVGDVVNARRTEGVQAMNAKAFDKALEPIGASVGDKIGEEAVAEAQDLVSQSFTRALQGKMVTIDAPFAGQAQSAMGRIKNIPRVGEEVLKQIDEMGIFDPNNLSLSGENMQMLLGSLRQVKQAYKGDPVGHLVNKEVSALERAVEGMFERQAPEVMPDYRAAKQAYRRLSVLGNAVNRAKNGQVDTGGVFTPGQLGLADRANSKKFDGDMAAAAGKSPFHQFQRDAQNVLPNRVPDSGTAGRLLVPLGLAGGGFTAGAAAGDAQAGTQTGIGVAAALSLIYSRGGQRLLTKRGPKMRAAGKKIKDRARIGGAVVGSQAALNSSD
jgi:hypothetical protein